MDPCARLDFDCLSEILHHLYHIAGIQAIVRCTAVNQTWLRNVIDIFPHLWRKIDANIMELPWCPGRLTKWTARAGAAPLTLRWSRPLHTLLSPMISLSLALPSTAGLNAISETSPTVNWLEAFVEEMIALLPNCQEVALRDLPKRPLPTTSLPGPFLHLTKLSVQRSSLVHTDFWTQVLMKSPWLTFLHWEGPMLPVGAFSTALETLVLWCTPDWSPHRVVQVLTHAISLVDFEVQSSTVQPPLAIPPVHHATISILRLDVADTLLETLLQSLSLPALTHLDIGDPTFDTSTLLAFLDRSRPQLRSFECRAGLNTAVFSHAALAGVHRMCIQSTDTFELLITSALDGLQALELGNAYLTDLRILRRLLESAREAGRCTQLHKLSLLQLFAKSTMTDEIADLSSWCTQSNVKLRWTTAYYLEDDKDV
ncbi:hypothetical protein C8R43DRAFT_1142970 [Mycena crocata]|nr:hypothetical protein C8R43DRAFT_1142970 [Mycena crocata]